MGLHAHKPIDEAAMMWSSPEYSICQVLREIYFTTDNPAIKLHARVATAMAKSMTAKMEEYKAEWEKGFWDKNPRHNGQVAALDHALNGAERVSTMQSKSGKTWDVFYFCENDWANSAFRYAKCLRLSGLNVLGAKIHPHPFFYPESLPTYPDIQTESIQHFVNRSHVTVLHNTTMVDGVDFSKANVVVQHGGMTYRQYYQEVNAEFNQFAKATIIQCPDLLGKGAWNEHWVTYPVDTDYIVPIQRKGHEDGKLVVGHFPSVPWQKGTQAINEVIQSIPGGRLKYVGQVDAERSDPKTWNDHLQRLSNVDVYIECLCPAQGKEPYGEFGNQCLEACAMGKIVITNCQNIDLYRKEYGEPGFFVANTPEQLREALDRVMGFSQNELNYYRQAARDWVVKHHSMPATSKRLWDKVYRRFF